MSNYALMRCNLNLWYQYLLLLPPVPFRHVRDDMMDQVLQVLVITAVSVVILLLTDLLLLCGLDIPLVVGLRRLRLGGWAGG
jgi:hypothetical protein